MLWPFDSLLTVERVLRKFNYTKLIQKLYFSRVQSGGYWTSALKIGQREMLESLSMKENRLTMTKNRQDFLDDFRAVVFRFSNKYRGNAEY